MNYQTTSSSYTNAFIEWSWKNRGNMNEAELVGLHAAIVVFTNSVLEAFIAECQRNYLNYNDSPLRKNIATAGSEVYIKNERVHLPLAGELELIDNIKQSIDKSLDQATSGKLKDIHATLFGTSFSSVLGDLNETFDALGSFRNVIAHGREIHCEVSGIGGTIVSFEKSSLKKIEKYLKTKGHDFNNRVGLPLDHIFSDDIVVTIVKDAEAIRERYLQSIPHMPLLYKLTLRLPRLPKIEI